VEVGAKKPLTLLFASVRRRRSRIDRYYPAGNETHSVPVVPVRPGIAAGPCVRQPCMRSLVVQAMALAVGIASASATPPSIGQGSVTDFPNGAGPGIVTQLSQPAPNGLLIQTELPVGAAGAEPCQTAEATSWWYDPTAYTSGADYEYGAGAGATGEPAFVNGTSYALALPPEPPFTFSGVLPAGPQSCSQTVAFVVAAQADYRLEFTATGGAITFTVGPQQLAGQGARPITITGSVSITQELTAGVWSITLNDGNSSTTAWSISGAVNEAPASTATTPTPAGPARLTITGLKPVRLAQRPPILRFTAQLSKATTLDLLLLDSKGRTLARWRLRATNGTNHASLVLPTAARHPGRDRLRVTQAGTASQTALAVVVNG